MFDKKIINWVFNKGASGMTQQTYTGVIQRNDIAIYHLYTGLPSPQRKYRRNQEIELVERGPLPLRRNVRL